MHIPEVEKAISELGRVLAPGGVLVVSESNKSSLESALIRSAKYLTKRGVQPQRVPAGFEYWSTEATGALVTRETDIGWLTRAFGSHGMKLYDRHSGQFTELYTRLPTAWLRKSVHLLNEMWFRFIPIPHLAFGNILFFEKTAD